MYPCVLSFERCFAFELAFVPVHEGINTDLFILNLPYGVGFGFAKPVGDYASNRSVLAHAHRIVRAQARRGASRPCGNGKDGDLEGSGEGEPRGTKNLFVLPGHVHWTVSTGVGSIKANKYSMVFMHVFVAAMDSSSKLP